MSTRKKSRKRTGSFKRGNPRELKDALSAAEVQAPNLLSLFLEETESFCSTVSVLAADLEDKLEYGLMLRSVVGELAVNHKLSGVVTDHFQGCLKLVKQLESLSKKGTESHRKRSKALAGGCYQTVRSTSLSETGKVTTWGGLSDKLLKYLADPKH